MASNRSNWLMRQVRERYEHPLEVDAYSEQVANGLTPEEKAILSQYVPEPCRVLDIGCGAGREAIALASQGYRVVATDISRSMLRAARSYAAEYGVNVACVWMPEPLRLPVPNAAFDCALGLAQLLSHIPGRDGRIRFLREVKRALVPEGFLIATITERESAADLYDSEDAEPSALEKSAGWEEGDIWVWQPSEAKLDTPLYFHLHTRDEITDELAAAGLEMISCTPGDKLLNAKQLTDDEAKEARRYWYLAARRIN